MISEGAYFTHRRVLSIALPMLASGLSVPLLGLVDAGVIGHLGDEALIGAVGLGALLLSTLYWGFGFLRMGVTGQTAQATGRRDDAEIRAILVRALLLGLAIGIVLLSLQKPLIALGLHASPASVEVETAARSYLSIRIWGAPATIGLYALNGWLIARERMRAVLLLQFWVNGLNILLDFFFVPGCGFGVIGVAWATLIAELSGLVIGVWFCRDAFLCLVADWARIASSRALIDMARLNGDIFVRNAVLQAIFLSFMFKSAAQGDMLLAVNQLLLLILETVSYAIDGFAFAAEVMVGQAVGRASRNAYWRAIELNAIWAAILAIILVTLLALCGAMFVAALTSIEDLPAIAASYLPWVVVAPVVAAPAYFWDGVFTGATRSRAMVKIMILSGAGYAVALSVFPNLWGNHGLWAALLVSLGMRSLLMTYHHWATTKEVPLS